jgi:hypothetical protein
MQGSSLEYNIAGIPYSMNERQRWLLANAMAVAHKKANKSAALKQINWRRQTGITKSHCVSLFND